MVGFVLIGLFGGLFTWAELEEARFERRAADEIRSQLGGSQALVEVQVQPAGLAGIWGDVESARIQASQFELDRLPLFTEPWRSDSGRLRRLDLDLEDFVLNGLRVESLRASIHESRYDFGLARGEGTIRLSRSGSGDGEVVLLAEDLARFVTIKYPQIQEADVTIERGRVRVVGRGEFLLIKASFDVVARIEPRNGVELHLVGATILFDGELASPPAAQAVLDLLNPVVDLREDLGLFDAVFVERLIVEEGRVIALGRTKIPTSPDGPPG